jgi:DNA-binding protein Fis
MPNMSYCRFENTARALRDCVNAIQDNEVNDLSTYEVNGLAELQLLAMDIVAMQDEIGEIIDSNKERFVTN